MSTVIDLSTLEDVTFNSNLVDYLYLNLNNNNLLIWQRRLANDYLTFTATTASTVGLRAAAPAIDTSAEFKSTFNSDLGDYTLYYSKNGGTFTQFNYGTTISLATGDTLQIYGDNSELSAIQDEDTGYYPNFKMTGSIKASGNITSIIDASCPEEIEIAFAFAGLFDGCTVLTQAPDLKVSKMSELCFYGTFKGCTGLTTFPKLPSTNLVIGCYLYMFKNCTQLTTFPQLPATELADLCYSNMFEGCTSLINIPSFPNSTLAIQCYLYMFKNCTSLVNAPELTATTLASGCYMGMFQNCTSMVTPPSLPATTINGGCYHEMFRGCTKLKSMPELKATTLYSTCYLYMFEGCTSLTTIYNFPNQALSIPESAMYGMFKNCTSLTRTPLLRVASNPGTYACYGIFSGCSSLKDLYVIYYDSLSTNSAFYYWVQGVASSGNIHWVKTPVTAPDWRGYTATASNYYTGEPSGWSWVSDIES